MNVFAEQAPHICIACGGTGGHLFPGIAVARKLQERGCSVTLMISQKEVDQQGVRNLENTRIVTLPAVGLTKGAAFAFARGFASSFKISRKYFKASPPHVAIAMGGFTSAPPLLAAKMSGARVFLHESNSIPGRANRWISWLVEEAYVGFPGAADRLHSRATRLTGTPVRPEFAKADPRASRAALGLDPNTPVILVMGGSQGAEGINRLVLESLPTMAGVLSDCQWLHIAGHANSARVEEGYRKAGMRAVVHGFMARMDLALGAATVAISRSGASSLAELAAMRVPPILIPYPIATDNHQYWNARAFTDTGAAVLLEQTKTSVAEFQSTLVSLLGDEARREGIKRKLEEWHAPQSADLIARMMLNRAGIAGRPEQTLISGLEHVAEERGRSNEQQGTDNSRVLQAHTSGHATEVST